MKPALTLLFIVILAAACNKTTTEEPKPEPPNYLFRVKKMQSRNDTLYRGVEFSYNDKNLIVKTVIRDTPKTQQLIKPNETITIEYIYDGDDIVEEVISSSIKGKSYAKYTIGNLSKLVRVEYSKTRGGTVDLTYHYFHSNDSIYALETIYPGNETRYLREKRNDTTDKLTTIELLQPGGTYRALYSELVVAEKTKYSKSVPGLKNLYSVFPESPEFFSDNYMTNYAVLDKDSTVTNRINKSTSSEFDNSVEKEVKTWNGGSQTTYYTLEQYIP